jgi:hypothetical protein
MGILDDTQWLNGTSVVIFGKTKENFSYKISEFRCKFGAWKDPGIIYDSQSKKSNMSADTEYNHSITFIPWN